MQAFYNGLSGMFNFSKSLDNVSNNISNMNTPGFKGNDVFIRSLSEGGSGYGSQVNSSSIRSQAGDLRQTGNETDLAITGSGYFILQDDDGKPFYTRAGQFRFDENNVLVDSATGYSVMAVDDLGVLRKLDVSENKLLPPVATTDIKLVGNLDPTITVPQEVSDVLVYDAQGETHNLTMEFTQAAAPALDMWDVIVKDSLGITLTNFQIGFGSDFTPLPAFSSVTQSFAFGGLTQNIVFDIGTAGSFAGLTHLVSTNTPITAMTQNGHSALGLRSFSFDEDGVLEFKYANGETAEGQQIALANFNDPSTLHLTTIGLMAAPSSVVPIVGKPNKENFGTIQSKSIEMSNVDLTQEFADILIIQRGYQASSRVMSVSNDMLEQLYNNTRS